MNQEIDLIDNIQLELNDENDIENHQIVPPLIGISTLLDNPAADVPETNDINLFRESIMFLEVIGLTGLQPPGQPEEFILHLYSAFKYFYTIL
jgi:hypothetical protein